MLRVHGRGRQRGGRCGAKGGGGGRGTRHCAHPPTPSPTYKQGSNTLWKIMRLPEKRGRFHRGAIRGGGGGTLRMVIGCAAPCTSQNLLMPIFCAMAPTRSTLWWPPGVRPVFEGERRPALHAAAISAFAALEPDRADIRDKTPRTDPDPKTAKLCSVVALSIRIPRLKDGGRGQSTLLLLLHKKLPLPLLVASFPASFLGERRTEALLSSLFEKLSWVW